MLRSVGLSAVVLSLLVPSAFGWGHTGHEMINRIAAEKLPADVPAFLRSKAAIEEIEYLGPEPDRWKAKPEPELGAAGFPEHFLDMEWADMVGPLPRKRFEFIHALQLAQAQHPDLNLTPDNVGLLPYEATEVWERLKAAMRMYRLLETEHKNTKPAEESVIFYAGWLGHYVADGSQPLHATMHYNGWTGDNPNGYSTSNKIHGKFEGDFVKANVTASEVAALVPAAPVPHGDIFDDYVAYLRHTHSLVEKLYQIDKTGGFDGVGTPEGKTFAVERVAAGANELRDLIYFAWTQSSTPLPPSKYSD